MANIDTPFPHAQRRQLANPPIELIIAQVRFPTIAELFATDGFVRFAQEVRGEFPNASPESQVTLEINPDRVSERSRVPVWRFEDLSGDWNLTLTPDFLALETHEYRTFSDFCERFVHTCTKLSTNYSIQSRTRLGLRYVNRYADDKQTDLPEQWLSLVRQSVFAMRDIGPKLAQSAHIAHKFVIKEDLELMFRSVLRSDPNSNSTGNEFVLDLDCYDPSNGSIEDIGIRMADLKEVAHNAFWWTLKDLINHMESANASN